MGDVTPHAPRGAHNRMSEREEGRLPFQAYAACGVTTGRAPFFPLSNTRYSGLALLDSLFIYYNANDFMHAIHTIVRKKLTLRVARGPRVTLDRKHAIL